MSLSEKQIRFTSLVSVFIQLVYDELGMGLTFGEVYRPTVTQEEYIKRGLSKTMNSKHLKRLAVDFNLFIDGKYISDKEMYRPLGELWESLGGRWGGRFGVERGQYPYLVGWDANHFEYDEDIW